VEIPQVDSTASLPAGQVGRLSWSQLTRLEPRLCLLHAEVSRVRDTRESRWFCANREWFSRFKAQMCRLVGWSRIGGGPDVLYTPEAYDLAYQTLYDLLPNCRNCGCPTWPAHIPRGSR
jgi:hypothetical protein